EMERIHRFLISWQDALKANFDPTASEVPTAFTLLKAQMAEELSNDFNIPGAMSHFFALIRDINRDYLDENKNYQGKKKINPQLKTVVEDLLNFVSDFSGLVYSRPQNILDKVNQIRKTRSVSQEGEQLSTAEIENRLSARQQARQDKNWAGADQIRKDLAAAGIEIKDNPDGTVTWKYK
ncbi:MAG: DALR domain-containing protein, partial [Pseudomonadota bacterium]